MKNREGQYNDFAYFYDVLMSDVDYDMWSRYINDIIHRYNVKYLDVLEMACGTGNMSIKLVKHGYQVTAFDISEDMLSVASKKIIENGVRIKLLHQDMLDIKLSGEFGVILCLCDSINYITSKKELGKMFKWVFNHLRAEGLFIFDINSSYKLKNIIGSNTFTHISDKLVYIWDNYVTDEDTVEFYLTFFVEEGGVYRRFEEVHTERVYEISDIVSLLKDAGFEEIKTNKAFTFEDPDETCERINFVVRK